MSGIGMHREAAKLLSTDDALAPLVEEYGPLSLEPAEDIFARLVVSIIRQQVSMDAAAAIRERLFDAVDVTPAGIQSAGTEPLREAGLSTAKAEYVQAAAEHFERQAYDREHFSGMETAAVIDELKEIKGVGPWTGKMFCLFCLGRPDVFPVEDLGIRKGMQAVVDAELSRSEMVERAERWRPYRSYASLYLWESQDE